jgi:hypothetical protein
MDMFRFKPVNIGVSHLHLLFLIVTIVLLLCVIMNHELTHDQWVKLLHLHLGTMFKIIYCSQMIGLMPNDADKLKSS